MSWIHVYRADLGALSARACFHLLDQEEKRRALGISDRRARREFVNTRALLRLLLSRYACGAANELKFAYGATGKPVLREAPGVHFNVAHSGGMALVAISSAEVGIDLEQVTADLDTLAVAPSVFSGKEIALLTATPSPERTDVFFSIWTRKEAYLKATGQGFSAALGDISTLSAAGVIQDETSKRAWYALDLPGFAGFKAAVVSPARPARLGVADVTEPARAAIEAQAPRLPRSAH